MTPQLQPAGDADGASLSVSSVPVLRVGVIALVAAALVAAALFGLTHRSHAGHGYVPQVPRVPVSRRPAPTTRAVAHRLPVATGPFVAAAAGGARLAVAGLPQFSAARAGVPAGATGQPAVSYAHDLSASDLVSLADGSTTYEPPAYLAAAYRQAARRYGIPWRVLAAIEYIQGGYVQALAGSSTGALRSVAARAGSGLVVNPHVLAAAVSASDQPSVKLLADARRLAADGAAQSTAEAVYKYVDDSASAQQAVMTLAQEIGSSGITTSSGPMAKLVAMQDEAHLLNGLPYIWGGGHTDPAWVVGAGYDCSGFVSEVLHAAGYLDSPDTTQTLPGSAGIAKGAGKYVTIYDRTDGGLKVWLQERNAFLKRLKAQEKKNVNTQGVHVTRSRRAASAISLQLPPALAHPPKFNVNKPNPDNSLSDDHVIIDLNGQWWESGGDSADGGAAQVHRIDQPSSSYLNSFNLILHPSGL